MEYEKKYKQALEKAKDLLSYKEVRQEDMEYIFPELKECENEQIRKDILCYFEHYAHDIKGADTQKWIDWLKKQKNTSDKEYVFRPLVGDTIEKAAERAVKLNGKVVLAFNGAYIPVDNKTKDKIVAEYCNWIKKQGEQKIADKTKPKFKVGDWLQYRYAEPFLVEEITEQGYCNGNSCLPFEWEDEIHLWSIQDAKDGDVLVDSYSKDSIIILYKGIYKERTVLAHCGWNGYNLTVNTNGLGYGGLDNTNYLPATKEQRDLLFEKMKEAGYEWDQKEKELIKMKETKFKVGDWVVTDYGRVSRVVYVDKYGDGYTLDDGVYFSGSWCDTYHLWTIQDAKDGDVLVASDGSIFLFAGVVDCACKYYVALTTDNHVEINKEAKGGYWETSRAVHPATKEQRELLFEKMKEAGYDWDAKNKTLWQTR